MATILPETLAVCLSACALQVSRLKANRNRGTKTRMRYLESLALSLSGDAGGQSARARPLVTNLEAQELPGSIPGPLGRVMGESMTL